MKKFLLFAALALFVASCSELKRANPTDPEASNYEGIHYNGSVTGFTGIYDIYADSGKLYVSDSSKKVYSYLSNNDMEWNFGETVFTNPVSVCAVGVTLAVADTGAGNYLHFFDLTTFGGAISYNTMSLSYAPGKVRSNGTSIYVTDPVNSMVHGYDMHFSNFASPLSFGGIGTGTGQFLQISDIQVTATEVFVSDSQAGKISVFTTGGAYLRSFETFTGIRGFVVRDGSVFVPSTAGIKEYNHSNGALIKTYANYGEGSGRVIKASWAAGSGSRLLIENNSDIKEFIP